MASVDQIILIAAALFFLFLLVFGRWRARARLAPLPLSLGGRYELLEPIAEGGMGTVFRGWDAAGQRPVAIKRLRDGIKRSALQRARFLHEAELAASLRHPHIVAVHDVVLDAAGAHLVLEYISGRTVHALLNSSPGRHLAPPRALEILEPAAEAVDHAHRRLVLHRDLKPANLMVDKAGLVKVMDFGLASQIQDSARKITSSAVVGTPSYMAPEQAAGMALPESDVFALGVTLYEMLTGGLPFKGPDSLRDKLEGRFLPASELLPGLPSAIDAVLARALAPRPESRYRLCRDLFTAAAAALSFAPAAA